MAIARTVSREDENSGSGKVHDKRLEIFLGDLVNPVEVFHGEDQRLKLADPEKHVPQRFERAALDHFRAQGLQSLRALPDAEKLQEIRQAFSRVHDHDLENGSELLEDG